MTPPSYLDAKGYDTLSPENTKLLLGFLFMAKDTNDDIVPSGELDARIREISPKLADQFFVSVMVKRLAVMRPDLSFSVPLLIWCANLADRVGVAVHWAYTLMDFERRNGRPMTMQDWCTAFPMGPPREKEMHRLWDAQKVSRPARPDGCDGDGSDNSIDGREAWASQHIEIR